MAGLPVISINFFSELKKQRKRSNDGTVALILKDDSQTEDVIEYKSGDKIEGWTAENQAYIEQSLAGGAGKSIVVKADLASENYTLALAKLDGKRFNYMAIPGISGAETDIVVEWIKDKRKTDKQMYKAVLANTTGDHESIINFTTDEIRVGGDVFNASEYTARIAGILAGMPYTRSATYYVLGEVDDVKKVEDPDTAIGNGELILINDGEKVKIGRGVNSLTTIREDEKQTEDWKSIRVVEILDMIHDEIYREFSDNYVGKVPNIYDNQVLYFNELNTSFKELERLQLLDRNFNNNVFIDVDSQRQAWLSVGKVEASEWDEEEVKLNSYKRNVFLAGNIKVVETMEDLEINVEI